MAETTDEKELAFDLRQIYAKDILGEHLKDIARARKIDDFSSYFKCLKDVYIVAQHKFKDKEEAKKEYERLMKIVVDLANKYEAAFLGTYKDPKPRAEIEQALNNVEIFLYNKIEEADMFGSKWDDSGL